MQISSRSRSRAHTQGAARRGRPAPSPVAEWISELVRLFASPDPRDRDRAGLALRQGIRSSGGTAYPPGELLGAFRREVESGRLRSNPDAHVELARALSASGDAKGAGRRLLAACALAAERASTDDPIERQRASTVNHRASLLFNEMGDRYQGDARYAVSRFYSRLPQQRRRGDLVPRVPGDAGNFAPGPVMHAPWPRETPPARLTRGEGRDAEPNAPPEMEGRAVPAMQGIELLNTISAWIGACRDLHDMAGFLTKCERLYVDRNYLRAPLKPAEVETLERDVLAGLRDPDPRVRASAQTLCDSIDFNLLRDCSTAYWGRTP